MPDQLNLGLLVLRAVFGLFLAYHGYNKFFGGGRIGGTARWFGSIGFTQPKLQAYMAASTEIGAGVLLAAGLLTPLAAAGVIAVMTVAIVSSHRKNGFFIYLPGGGWEYCASIAAAAFAIGAIGPGEWSLDDVFEVGSDLRGGQDASSALDDSECDGEVADIVCGQWDLIRLQYIYDLSGLSLGHWGYLLTREPFSDYASDDLTRRHTLLGSDGLYLFEIRRLKNASEGCAICDGFALTFFRGVGHVSYSCFRDRQEQQPLPN